MVVDEQDGIRMSYANIVGYSAREANRNREDVGDWECDPNKVEVLDEDCVIDRTGKFPTIEFSERVHKQIDSTMRNVIIVRLLGRNIGYQTLLNRMHALWKHAGEIQLIDLENYYFLVRVEDLRDYRKILTEGPWTIYGSYLTVQPWSRAFSTSEKHPSRVVVWVHFPGLPYRYYSKALFRRIAEIVRDVVKVDYNTQAGERGKFARLAITVDLNKHLVSCIGIDDFIQNLEYEGLHHICYSCGVYGHLHETCMEIRGKDNSPTEDSTTIENVNASSKDTSRDSSLFGPWMTVENRRKRVSSGRSSSSRGPGKQIAENVVNRFAVLEKELVEPMEEQRLESSGDVANERGEEALELINRNSTLVATDTHKNVPKNAAYRASNPEKKVKGNRHVFEKAVIMPMVEGQPVSMVENAQQGGNKVHVAVSLFKKGHGMGSSDGIVLGKTRGGGKARRMAHIRWVDDMNMQMTTIATRSEGSCGSTRALINQDGALEPIVSGNALSGVRIVVPAAGLGIEEKGSGAASPTFRRFLLAFKREYSPRIVALFEPMMGGRQADKVVQKFGYSHSFRVEGQGFSGDPGADIPWIVEGDFNVILSADERRGGVDTHVQGSRPFEDFIFQSGLADMGFRGPHFTWSRGNLYERLDRCLANTSWLSCFPHSHVLHLEKNGSDHRPLLLCSKDLAGENRPRLFRYISTWQDHPSFDEFQKSTWDTRDLLSNIESFRPNVRDWNSSVFGHIGRRKKRLLARLKGIDMALARAHSDSLVVLGQKLREELESVIDQEESLWSQKACANWIHMLE
ncbi:hypothetical protein GQ457_10G018520 [Hibiscus cannabinus]